MADVRTTTKVEGPQASDAPVSDNPVVVGGRASTAIPTPVSADGDAVQQWLTREGASVVSPIERIGSGIIDAAAETVEFDTGGLSAVALHVTGTWNGSFAIEATADGTNWELISAYNWSAELFASTVANGEFAALSVGGYAKVRIREFGGSTGSTTVAFTGTMGNGPLPVHISNLLPGTDPDSLGKPEDGAHTSGAVGVMSLGVRNDTPSALATTNNDYIPFTTDSLGKIYVNAAGAAASDAAVAGNPLLNGGRASTAIPTAVSTDGDAVAEWLNRNGAQLVTVAPHVGLNSDPWNLVHEAAEYTTQQTSTVLIAGAGSEKIVVTKLQIQAKGTTAFDIQVYFGTGAFVRGTNRAAFDGTFIPSATIPPGVVLDGPFIAGTNGDDLMVTTSAGGTVVVNVWYYVVT